MIEYLHATRPIALDAPLPRLHEQHGLKCSRTFRCGRPECLHTALMLARVELTAPLFQLDLRCKKGVL